MTPAKQNTRNAGCGTAEKNVIMIGMSELQSAAELAANAWYIIQPVLWKLAAMAGIGVVGVGQIILNNSGDINDAIALTERIRNTHRRRQSPPPGGAARRIRNGHLEGRRNGRWKRLS